MNTLTASEARANLYRLIDQTVESHEPIIISGKRNSAVLLSAEQCKRGLTPYFRSMARRVRPAKGAGVNWETKCHRHLWSGNVSPAFKNKFENSGNYGSRVFLNFHKKIEPK